MMNASDLVSRVVDIAENYKTVYMWGTFGAPVTESTIRGRAKQYPRWYTPRRIALFNSLIGKGYFAFDCVNLIKGVLWGWNGDDSKSFGGATYASNGVPDVSADGMISLCKNVSTDFSNIPEGAALWLPGHFGLYIGDGLAVECTPKWDNKVQITAVGNIGHKSGYNTRTWRKWGLIPYVNYNDNEEDNNMERYTYLKDVPDNWDKKGNPRTMVEGFMNAGLLGGDGSDPEGNGDVIDVSKDMIRVWATEFRAGLYDAAFEAAGLEPDEYR